MNIIALLTFRYIRGYRSVGLFSLKSRISFIVMVAGISLLIVVLSVFNGFQKQIKKSLWESGIHITIENNLNSGKIKNYQKIISYIKKNISDKNSIQSIEPNIHSYGLIQNHNEFLPITIRSVPIFSVDALISNQLPNFPKIVFFDKDRIKDINSKNYIIIGQEIASMYHYEIGDRITLAVPSGEFSISKGVDINIEDFQIIGYFKTGNYNYDSKYIFMSLNVAQSFFNLNDVVNQIVIKVQNLDVLKEEKNNIKFILSNEKVEEISKQPLSLNFRTIEEENANFIAALKLEKTIISIIVFLFIILAALGMVINVYSLVRSKEKSIGTLKALGLSSSSILLIFTLNAMIIGIFASIVGGIIGIFLASNLESILNIITEIINLIGFFVYQYDWINIELLPKDIYFFDHIPIDIDIPFIFMITTISTILSGLSGYFPARWAAELDPIKIIKNE